MITLVPTTVFSSEQRSVLHMKQALQETRELLRLRTRHINHTWSNCWCQSSFPRFGALFAFMYACIYGTDCELQYESHRIKVVAFNFTAPPINCSGSLYHYLPVASDRELRMIGIQIPGRVVAQIYEVPAKQIFYSELSSYHTTYLRYCRPKYLTSASPRALS